jgi:hypothetical protein
MRSAEYEAARSDLAATFRSQLAAMDDMYDVVEPFITSGAFTIVRERMRGLNEGTVHLLSILLAKALKTFRAIKVTCLEGCGQDAAVLLRVLFETTIAVLWILQSDSLRRGRMFAAHEDHRLVVMLEGWSKTPGLDGDGVRYLPKAQARLQKWGTMLDAASLAACRKHWSGERGLERVCEELPGQWAKAYHTVYRSSSNYAHGADSLTHAQFKTAAGGPVLGLLPGDAEIGRTTSIACLTLFTVADRINERLGLGHDDALKSVRPAQQSEEGREG